MESTDATIDQKSFENACFKLVGRLTHGLAHDLNNPVGFVANNLEFLAERIAAATIQVRGSNDSPPRCELQLLQEAKEAIDESRVGLREVANKTRTIGNLSQRLDDPKTATNLDSCMQDALTLCGSHFKNVRITTDLNASHLVTASQGLVRQLFCALLLSSIDGSPGDMHVSSRNARGGVNVNITRSGMVSFPHPEDYLQTIVDGVLSSHTVDLSSHACATGLEYEVHFPDLDRVNEHRVRDRLARPIVIDDWS